MGFTKKQRREQKQQFQRRVHGAKTSKPGLSHKQANEHTADKAPKEQQQQAEE